MKETLKLDIDEYQLDEEWINQPRQYHYWAVELADAQLVLDAAKSDLEVVKADLDMRVREDLVAQGKKVTETLVSTEVINCKQYQESTKEVNKSRHTLNLTKAAVEALEHRKRALEKLVDLHGRDYFSEPTSSVESRENVEAMEKRNVRRKGKKKR